MTYHRGEQAVQARANASEPAGRMLRTARATVPEVAAAFLAKQRAIFLGASDSAGRIWATMLTGEPGFLLAPTVDTVTIAVSPSSVDPLAEALSGPTQLGAIAIEPATRRRMRINGRSEPTGTGLLIHPEQVISNCPKYIQKRTPEPIATGAPSRAAWGTALTSAQQQAIRAADTFFVASAADDGSADTSHRGGNPGFVEVSAPTRISWPDYAGNSMFLTLGNFEVHSAAGLLFPFWHNGSTLHLSGTATVDFSAERAARFPGAQRVVDFTITDVVEISGASPLRWTAPEYSKFNPHVDQEGQ